MHGTNILKISNCTLELLFDVANSVVSCLLCSHKKPEDASPYDDPITICLEPNCGKVFGN